MLINLSSITESSASKFSNEFTDNLIIKPNSKICLIRASLVREGEQLSFVIPAGMTISFRTSPYDIYTTIINATNTQYTPQGFVDRLNILLSGKIAWNYRIEARLEKVGEHDFEIEITSYRDHELWNTSNLNDFIWGDTITFYSSHKQCIVAGGADLLLPTVDEANELRGILFTTGPRSGLGAGWGSNITPLLNQVNGGAHNCFTGAAFAPTVFTLCSPPLREPINFTFSPAAFRTATDRYETGSAPTMTGAGIPLPVNIQINVSDTGAATDGTITLFMKDHTTDTTDTIGSFIYNPGDRILTTWRDGIEAAGYDSEHLFFPHIVQQQQHGLIAWFPMLLNAGKSFNNYQTPYEPQEFYWNGLGTQAELAANFSGDRMYGCRTGRGMKAAEKVQIDAEYVSALDAGHNVMEQYGGADTKFSKMVFFRAYSAGSGVTDVADRGDYFLIDNDGIMSDLLPTFMSLLFTMEDKTAFTAQTSRVLLGGETVLITLSIDNAGGGTPDMTIIENDGATTHTFNLLDVGANRIVWAYNRVYLFQLASFGNAVTDFKCNVIDTTTGITYFNNGNWTARGIDKISRLGAGNTANTNNQRYLHGYMGEFRVYQTSLRQGIVNTLWDNLIDAETSYWSGAAAGWNQAINGGYYCLRELTDIYGLGEFKYCNYGSEDNLLTITPFVGCPGVPDVYDADWFNLQDVHFYPCIRQPNSTRNQTETTVDIYGNKGQGLVAINDLDDILDFPNYRADEEREIMVQQNNLQDDIDDPIFSATTSQTVVDIDDKIFNVEIKNLPHITYNGTSGNFDKTVYQIGSLINGKTIEGKRIVEQVVPQKVWIPLNNGGDMILNQIDVQISDEYGVEESDLLQETHLTLEIQ